MYLSLIVAMAKNRTIGFNGDLPWHLPGDMAYFKQTTLGKPVIMGRKTYESLQVKPLPNRENIVLTRDEHFQAPACHVTDSLEQALELPCCQQAEEVMVIGGAQIYRQALPLAKRIYLTRVHAEFMGDTLFPELQCSAWQEISHCYYSAIDQNPYAYSILCLNKSALTD